jgi:hypothetical protein
MACERYKVSLADAALGELERVPEAELRAHLENCAACRTAFDAERRLVAAIDWGVAASVAAEPSPELAARVRQRIEAVRVPARPWFAGSWIGRWVPAAAGALVVLALVTMWLARREPARPGKPESAKNVPSQHHSQSGAGVPGESVTPRVLPVQPVGSAAGSRRPHIVRKVVLKAAEAEVLVPPGQREAILRLYEAVRSGRADAASLLAERGSLEPVALKIAPLEVAALGLDSKPLEAASDH